MPYDPTLPAQGSPLASAVMRSQLQGLKALIDAITSLTDAQVDGVSTVNPGDPATVGLTVSGNTLHFSFGIPRGQEGLPGQAGQDGAVGPPFAQAIIDAVTTLGPSDPATVSVSFDGLNVHFNFGIPQGQPGQAGQDGGVGPMGEVSNAALAGAINGTSSNSNAVTTLDTAFANDPPTIADMETLRLKMNELILTLRR